MSVIDAAYATVHDHPGGANALAPRFVTRAGGSMSPAVLCSKVDQKKDSHHLTLVEADKLMSFTGDLRILHALARSQGHVCVRLERDIEVSDMAVLELVALVWQGQGDVGEALHEMLADGRITSSEMDHFRVVVHQAETRLHQLVQRVDAMREPD